jgi:uncharacterized lipoprotein YddW (UPF0748 family)
MTPSFKHWAWVNTEPNLPDDEWKRRLARMKAAGIGAILPEIFNNRAAAYQSAHLPVLGPWLEQLLPLAREAGLEVHAWMHAMTCTIPQVNQEHRDWFAVNGLGESAVDKPAYVGYYQFLCPSHPEVQAFLRQRVEELSRYAELTSIHLDYIRFPDVILAAALQPQYGIVQDREYPQYDYCYCARCRAGFEERTGTDPLSLPDPGASAQWRQFRCDLITHLVREVLAPIARRRGKQVTAAVFPNWEHVRQQWSAWDLDAVLPMLYHSFYRENLEWIGGECRRGVESLQGSRTALYSGLFVPALKPEELARAMQVSVEGGAQGVSLFSAGAMSEAHWEEFSRAAHGL